jgi:hypothetical protein
MFHLLGEFKNHLFLFIINNFQGQEGVRIMHQCVLCNPKYGSSFKKTEKLKGLWPEELCSS